MSYLNEKDIWEMYQNVMNERKNSDYELNQPQMDKLIDAYEFFVKAAQECGGKVDFLKIEPKAENGGVTARFTVFYLNGDNLQKLGDIVKNMSAISIDSFSDGDIEISFTIPDVFRHR